MRYQSLGIMSKAVLFASFPACTVDDGFGGIQWAYVAPRDTTKPIGRTDPSRKIDSIKATTTAQYV